MLNFKKSKEKFLEKISVFKRSDFYVKLSFTFFFIVLYIMLFLSFDGVVFFEKTDYAYQLKNTQFQVHCIDVKNGDAIIVRLPNNQTMMIDTGESYYSETVISYLNQYFHYENLNRIDYLVLTHSDSDHVGGAVEILNKFKVETIFRPKVYSKYEEENNKNLRNYKIIENETYNEVIKTAYRKKCNLQFTDNKIKIEMQDLSIEFLSPLHDTYKNTNDYSAVIMMNYKGTKFLFTGDIESDIEEELISEYGDKLRADVLKIAHHGSSTSSSQEFLDTVKPKYALISSSKNNPDRDVIKRLNEKYIDTISTGKIGSFVIGVKNGKIVYYHAELPATDMVLLFAIFALIIFIIWGEPIKKLISTINKIND